MQKRQQRQVEREVVAEEEKAKREGDLREKDPSATGISLPLRTSGWFGLDGEQDTGRNEPSG